MIRIHDEKRDDRVSPNITYTKNPKLYNLNDWVIVNEQFNFSASMAINPYVRFTSYEQMERFDERYQIIICTSKEQVSNLLLSSVKNKMIYLLPELDEQALSVAKPIIATNSFNNEQKLKVNHRNLYINEGKFGYSIQVERIFHHDVYAFLKLPQANNNCVFISCDITSNELYTIIGSYQPLDLQGLQCLDSNIIEFNIVDRFNRYVVLSNMVLDFNILQLFEPLKIEYRMEYLNFARKAYLTITGIKNDDDLQVIEGDIDLNLEVDKVNLVMLAPNQKIKVKKGSKPLIVLRNYLASDSKFYTNFKRQKVSKVIDQTTRLIIIYDPNDRGFIASLNRTNCYEIALNKKFEFTQIVEFAQSQAEYMDISTDNIVYLLDEQISIDCKYRGTLYLTNGFNIKNTIMYGNRVYNFTNIGMRNVEPKNETMMICQALYNPLTNVYAIAVPEQFSSDYAYIRIFRDGLEIYEALKLSDNLAYLYHSFFAEILEVDGKIEFQIVLENLDERYVSQSFPIVVDKNEIGLDYEIEKFVIYSVYAQKMYTHFHLQQIAKKFINCEVLVFEYGNSPKFEQFIADKFNISKLSIEQYELLIPIYLESLGYERVLFIGEQAIFESTANYYEVDSNLAGIKTMVGAEYSVYTNSRIRYFNLDIKEYLKLVMTLNKRSIPANELGVTTIELPTDNAPIIDYLHPVSPWDKNNLQVFEKYTNDGIFLNVELFEKLSFKHQNIYKLPISKLIERNNNLLNIGSRQKKLSIVITTYNNENAIYDTLSYIVTNMPLVSRDYEILVYDDCSPDKTVLIAENFFKLHPHVNHKLEVNKRNMRYPGYGANKGIRDARGKYIHIVDGDDKVINSIYKVLNEKQIDSDLIAFGHYNYDIVRNEYIAAKYYSKTEFLDKYPYEKSKAQYKMLQANVTHWNKFFKTEFLHQNHLYYLENQLVQDSAFLTDVYYCQPTVHHIPQMGYIYHIGQESVSSGRKGYKLFKDFVNANMKRTPLVNSIFPQYTYTMKRFMIYDEIKDEELEQVVDLLCEKYARNYRVTDLSFFNKEQMLYKLMHILLYKREYNKIRRFLQITDYFKMASGYNDSKYYDFFLGINRNQVSASFIINIKIISELFAHQINDKNSELYEHFVIYLKQISEKLEVELQTIVDIASNDYQFYKVQYEFIHDNINHCYEYAKNQYEFLRPLVIPKMDLNFTKTARKFIILKNGNDFIKAKLKAIDNDIQIYNLPTNYSEQDLVQWMSRIYKLEVNSESFGLIIDAASEIKFNNLYLIYHTEYPLSKSLIKLCENDDMFDISNKYLINVGMYEQHQFSHLAIFAQGQLWLKTESIEDKVASELFYSPEIIASGYEKPDSRNIEFLNDMYHNSPSLRKVPYHQRKQANIHLFDFNVEE